VHGLDQFAKALDDPANAHVIERARREQDT